MPYKDVAAVYNNPDQYESLALARVTYGTNGNTFVQDPNNLLLNEAYPYEAVLPGNGVSVKRVFITQPRETSTFTEKIRGLAALPNQTFNANMAATRLGEEQNLASLFKTTSYDNQRRYLTTSVFHAWVMCRARAWDPGLGPHTYMMTTITDYAKVKVLTQYSSALNYTLNEYNNIQSATPYYFNGRKLIQAAKDIAGGNAVLAQELFDSYLWLATNSTSHAAANVILVDISPQTVWPLLHVTTITNHAMSEEQFFTLFSTQHTEEDIILTRTLWPTSYPRINYLDATGAFRLPAAPRTLSIPFYNPFDHLAILMDDIEKQLPVIIWQNIANAQKFRTRIFYYINHFMRAYTINALGVPFPLAKLDSNPGPAPPVYAICEPFLSIVDVLMVRWRFQPWELLVGLGGTLSTKIKLATVPNSITSSDTDAPLTAFTAANGFVRLGPTAVRDVNVLPPSMYRAYAANVMQYHTPFTGINQPLPQHNEESTPAYILERRGQGVVASTYQLSGFPAAASIGNFRNKTQIYDLPFQNQYLTLGPL